MTERIRAGDLDGVTPILTHLRDLFVLLAALLRHFTVPDAEGHAT